MRPWTAVLASALVAACGGGADRTVIQNTGSDTMLDVAQAWAERYKTVDPSVAVAVSGGGSGTGIASMIDGTVDISNSSRPMTEAEIASARANGNDPVEHIVGYDALAVYLHRDNPIDALTLAQVAEIYAEGGRARRWSDLGVSVPGCPRDEIVRVSRQNSSGTYAYFRDSALGGREFELGALSMNGSSEVVDLVENTPCAIGYSGLAYATEGVKMPCIAVETGAECVTPSVATATDRTYPIARPLYMYTPGEAQGAVADYLTWILTDEGQCVLVEIGYPPARPLTCD
ncbi:MAG: phosphate ABC transporter substrate-binding protein [Gemmatimonadales bacterium]